jgi:hypothetical protein
MNKQKGGCVVLDNLIVPLGLVVAQKKYKDALDNKFSLQNSITSGVSQVIDGSIFDSFLDSVSMNSIVKKNKKTRKRTQRKRKGTRKNKIF